MPIPCVIVEPPTNGEPSAAELVPKLPVTPELTSKLVPDAFINRLQQLFRLLYSANYLLQLALLPAY